MGRDVQPVRRAGSPPATRGARLRTMSHAPHAARPHLYTPPHGRAGEVLVLLAHPALHRSRVNRALAGHVRGLEGVTVHDLYEAYPDFDLDIEAEKALLLSHRVIVWQHPFYWYSTPAILKEWQDLVLEFGWAYGPGGTALRGKSFLQAISTGGAQDAYTHEGYHQHTLAELLAPATQMAKLCGMERLAPYVVHGTNKLDDAAIAAAAAGYRERILSLRDAPPAPAP